MRTVSPARIIVMALVLIVIGSAPTIVSFLAVHLPRTAEWWPTDVLQPLFDHLAVVWNAVDAKLYLVRAGGVALLVVAAIWGLAARMDKLPWNKVPPQEPLRTSQVLLDETFAISGDTPGQDDQRRIDEFNALRLQRSKELEDDAALNEVSPYLYRWLNSLNRSALCLSGGGIRSACFALGVLQALATHPRRAGDNKPVTSPQKSLLPQFTYLSTVSGGGYIGSWLSTWITRVGYPLVWAGLVRRPDDLRDPGAEPHAISWLREHGNYLTPQLGLTSPDTLTTIAIFLRNLVLNWLVLLPLLCAPLILMKLLALVIFFLSSQNSPELFGWLAFIGLVLLLAALRFMARHRPSLYRHSADVWKKQRADQGRVIKRALLPNMAAAFVFTMCMALAASTKVGGQYGGWVKDLFQLDQGRFFLSDLLKLGAGCGAGLYALSWVASLPRVSQAGDFLRWTSAGAIYGMLVAVVAYFFANDFIGDWIFFSLGEWIKRLWSLLVATNLATSDVDRYKHMLVLIHFGVPLLLLAQLSAEMIFVGLSSYQPHSDDDREWLGRAAALSLLASVGWLIVMYLIFVGGDIAYKMITDPVESLFLAGALCITALLAAVLGRSHRTAAQSEPVLGIKPKSVHTILAIVAIICAGLLVVIASALLDLAVLGHAITDRREHSPGPDALRLLAALILVLILGANASKFINVNRFSMHALYRNRLVRTFLGATRDPRDANPFTNFDEGDNPEMYTLWTRKSPSGGAPEAAGSQGWRPFHIVNIALNVTSSEKHLAWQERKAAPFVVTPMHSGSAIAGFRDSEQYGGKISLGTAMAVSGAAASPNQGYNSSAPVAFLMALLNVRLGWWLGNPGRAGNATFNHDGPKTAARSLIAELIGATREDQEYVYLSDGGHFENLGIYEMVRRRCRLIVVSDAGCDPAFAFEDLGNAVRKIEIDLGVPIRFRGLPDLKPRPPVGRDLGPGYPYHAIGEIDYPAADGGGEKGVILYIKPGYHGSEVTAGVRSYAIANPEFPHDPTANQWFGESQMESYRALGFEITDNLLCGAIERLKDKTDPTLIDVVEALQSITLNRPLLSHRADPGPGGGGALATTMVAKPA
jgi:hypothetical protein